MINIVMPKSTTSKGTAARPPYKMKSAGTKWGIPLDSSEDSTPDPAPTRVTMTEEQPAREKHEIAELVPVEKDISDTPGDELLPKVASKDGEGSGTAKQMSERKKTLQKSKTFPVGTSKRGSVRSRAHPRRGRKVTTTVDDEWMADELECGAFDGMSIDDADAKMAQIFRRLG